MATCPRCGNGLSCSCQLVTLPDGSRGCTNCANRVSNNVIINDAQSSGQELTNAQKATIIQANNNGSN